MNEAQQEAVAQFKRAMQEIGNALLAMSATGAIAGSEVAVLDAKHTELFETWLCIDPSDED